MYNEGFGLSADKNPHTSAVYSGSNPALAGYGRSDDEIQVIKGKSFEECKQKLFQIYGHNYDIRGQRPVFKKGFLGFGQKEEYEVRYTIGQKKSVSPQEAFQKNRDEILNKNGVTVTQALQIANLDKKLEEYQKNLASKLEEIAAATTAGDKPVSIQKIEELLQENEFTF